MVSPGRSHLPDVTGRFGRARRTGSNHSKHPRSARTTRHADVPLTPFRMNTCKSASKQRTLSPFRMNTYAKPGEGSDHPLKRISLGVAGTEAEATAAPGRA